MRDQVRAHPLLAFTLLACAISWSIAPFALHPDWRLGEPWAGALGIALKFGPSAAGLILAGYVAGSAGVGDLLRRSVAWRRAPRWYVLALLGPLGVWAVAIAVFAATGGNLGAAAPLGLLWFVPLLAKHAFAGGGLGEELGWRGFVLPRLREHSGALGAALWIGVAWGLWHLPAFLLPGTGKEAPDLASAAVGLALFTLLCCALSLIFTWFHDASGASLWLLILLHGATNAAENTWERVWPALDGAGGKTIAYGLLVLALAIAAGFALRRGSAQYALDPESGTLAEPLGRAATK